MEQAKKVILAREWIIFALSIGLGGHVVVGLLLHGSLAPGPRAGWSALFIGLFIYAAVQAVRSIAAAIRSRKASRNR